MEVAEYTKSPEIVLELLKNQKTSTRSGKYIVFKRWDMLEENDRPEVVFFFASPDVLAGLFTLANFDETDPHGVTAPFAAGCGSIVYYPFLEILAERPRAVLGMFDPSARPCVAPGELSFSVPMKKFLKMIVHMEESFLITPTWKAILNRIKGGIENDAVRMQMRVEGTRRVMREQGRNEIFGETVTLRPIHPNTGRGKCLKLF